MGDNEDGEDERSIESHIVAMQKQWGRPNCDIISLSERMARTFTARREMVIAGEKLPDILTKYPALKDFSQVLNTIVCAFLYCLVK